MLCGALGTREESMRWKADQGGVRLAFYPDPLEKAPMSLMQNIAGLSFWVTEASQEGREASSLDGGPPVGSRQMAATRRMQLSIPVRRASERDSMRTEG